MCTYRGSLAWAAAYGGMPKLLVMLVRPCHPFRRTAARLSRSRNAAQEEGEILKTIMAIAHEIFIGCA